MKPRLSTLLLSLFGFALLAAVPGRAADTLAVGQRFPDLKSAGLEGTLPDLAGAKVVIVDFWASWCAPCKASFPVYDALQKEYGAQGVHVIAVNVDPNDKLMAAFLKKQPVSFAVVRDAQARLVAEVKVPTMPTSFVLDRAGVVRFVHTGFHGEETRKRYVEEIQELLKETP